MKHTGINLEAENFYAVWRQQCRAVNLLRDGGSVPPEKLLQAVWLHQRLQRDRLQTAEGRSVRVLHPGFLSTEGGPDFRGAVLQFDQGTPVTGDVEIDLQPSGWHAHGHDTNPDFKGVILHVVWEHAQGAKAANMPVRIALKDVLDAPPAELALALEHESGLPASLRGKCSAPLREFAEPQLTAVLQAAAKVRFQNKASALLARARAAGWEQALWEHLFRALGYKNNVWPMQTLAETKPRWAPGLQSAFDIQARLFGLSGLLPAELTRAQQSADTFLRRAWDVWWRDRDELADCILPRTVWKFHGLRPVESSPAAPGAGLALAGRPGKPRRPHRSLVFGGDSAIRGHVRLNHRIANYVLAFFDLGNVLDELQRLNESIAAYRRAVELAPGYADAHYNLALAHERLGEARPALRHWQAYARLDKGGPWSEHARGQIRKLLAKEKLTIAWRAESFIAPRQGRAALELVGD